MRPESAALLWDAHDAATSAVRFLAGASLREYEQNELRRRAVERALEIVGEALNKLRRVDQATAERIPGIGEAIGMRNVLIHGYADIIDERVYDTAVADLPALVDVLAGLLAENDPS